MIHTKSCFSLIVLLALGTLAQGQHDLGLRLNGGISRINISESTAAEKTQDNWRPSVSGGLYYTYSPPIKNSRVTAQLSFSQINGTQVQSGMVDYNGVDEVEGRSTFKRQLSFADLSLSAGFVCGLLTVDLGLQAAYTISAKEDVTQELTFVAEDSTSSFGSNDRTLDVVQLDYGLRLAIAYQIKDQFFLEGTYYNGLKNLKDLNNAGDALWTAQRFGVGIRYTFWSKRPEE